MLISITDKWIQISQFNAVIINYLAATDDSWSLIRRSPSIIVSKVCWDSSTLTHRDGGTASDLVTGSCTWFTTHAHHKRNLPRSHHCNKNWPCHPKLWIRYISLAILCNYHSTRLAWTRLIIHFCRASLPLVVLEYIARIYQYSSSFFSMLNHCGNHEGRYMLDERKFIIQSQKNYIWSNVRLADVMIRLEKKLFSRVTSYNTLLRWKWFIQFI